MLKKNNYIITLTLALVLFTTRTNAQEVKVIDNKGTIHSVNNNTVTTSNTAPITPLEDDLWFDTGVTPNIIKVWDGTSWLSISDNNKWSLIGNTGTNPTSNFLGTTDAQDLVFRTNNIEALRINQTNQYIGIGISGATSPLHINKNLADGIGIIRVQGTEPDINFNDTDGGFNTFTFENAGVPKFAFGRRNTDAFYITRNDGTWHDETFNILNNNGHVGLNTDTPTERLDINGKLRVRDITTTNTNNDILTTTATGIIEKKPLLAAEANNILTTGANGGAYLAQNTGGLTVNTQTLRTINRSRVLLQPNSNINANSVNNLTPNTFQLNETGATITGNNITNLEGNIRFTVYPNLTSSGSDRTNFNCNFLVNNTINQTAFTGLYARNASAHTDTGGAIIFEYENATLADQFRFTLTRETSVTSSVTLLNSSKIFIEQFREISVVTSVTAPVDLSIVQGPAGPTGPTGPTGPAGPAISSPTDVYYASGNIRSNGGVNYIQGASVVKNGGNGSYTVTFTSTHPTGNYPVILSLEQNAGTDDYGITYSNVSTTGFDIEIREQDDGGGGGVLRDANFSFYIPL